MACVYRKFLSEPYSAALISLSVPSTPTRKTLTSTPPRPFGSSAPEGLFSSARWTLFAFPGNTLIAFIFRVSVYLAFVSLRTRCQRLFRVLWVYPIRRFAAAFWRPGLSNQSDDLRLRPGPYRRGSIREREQDGSSWDRSEIW